MILRLVLAEIRNRPGRAAFLLSGYALGVAVMVVLLAVGEAMLSQARDQALLGGGDVLIVPAGINPEMLKSGGTNALFLGLDQARFIHRQMLESPRGRERFGVEASSPLLDGRLIRIGRGGRTVQALATGEIPSRATAVGGAVTMIAGEWSDSDADRQWVEPSPGGLLDEIDAFHNPPGSAVGDSTWAEWHYFNVVLDDDRWIYLTYLIGGRVGIPGEWGGSLLLTVRTPDGAYRSLSRDFSDQAVAFDTASADVRLGSENRVRQRDGVYYLRADVGAAEIDLQIAPSPNRYFPPTELGGADLVSGYVVPALAASARGQVCIPDGLDVVRCHELDGASAYHDHNWGVWEDVSWEWGSASDEDVSLLYGAVQSPEGDDQGIFAYLVDTEGVRGLFRADSMQVTGTEVIRVAGEALSVPTELRFEDPRSGLDVRIDVADRHVTTMDRDVAPYFIQMRGIATIRESGQPPRRLTGFFETFVEAHGPD